MTKYRKLFVALAGVAIAAIGRHFGVNSELYLDATGVATAAGVWAVPNSSTPPAAPEPWRPA